MNGFGDVCVCNATGPSFPMKEADRLEVRFRPIVGAYLLSSTRLALGYLSTYVWCVLLGLYV